MTEVQRLRIERGLTMVQLADLAKISQQTIFKMEQDPSNRTSKISPAAAHAVAEVFDKELSSLFRTTELSDGNVGRPIRTGGELTNTQPIRIISFCPDCNQQVSAREKNDGESECCSAKLAA